MQGLLGVLGCKRARRGLRLVGTRPLEKRAQGTNRRARCGNADAAKPPNAGMAAR